MSTKARRWTFRVRPQTDDLVREAATLAGQTLTSFVEESALARADKILAEHAAVRLNPEVFDRLVRALDTAPVAVPELVELFSRPSRIPST